MYRSLVAVQEDASAGLEALQHTLTSCKTDLVNLQVFFSVLQCAAVCCSAMQCVAVCCSIVMQCVAVCCSVLRFLVAVCCSVL